MTGDRGHTTCNIYFIYIICRIGHDHQAPFQDILVVVVLVVPISSGDMHEAKTTYNMASILQTSNIFTHSGMK